ncbi:hypothetical protein JCM21900_003113 [Sporobolomyces salmonicolor]
MATLNLSNPALALSFSPVPLAVIQLKPSQPVPAALLSLLSGGEGVEVPSFLSFTRTPVETSVILPSSLLAELYPPTSTKQPHETSGPCIALVVAGPMDLSLTGILHALTGPLKDAKVPVFASSTWDTDYVLINEEHRETARQALEAEGWRFSQ